VIERIFELTKGNAIIATEVGQNQMWTAQFYKFLRARRIITSGGLGTMGHGFPAAMGAQAAFPDMLVIDIAGDGSIQMNIQELETIVHNKLPVKIIILNNNGYLLIRHSQNNFMDGRLIGESSATGVSFPDMEKISAAYGIPFVRISNLGELSAKLDIVRNHVGPLICEVMTPANQLLIPRVASKSLADGSMVSMPYDDMFPFLPREEYEQNCVHDRL
jgi:acetolactate synthase-1/2/3 large subunit